MASFFVTVRATAQSSNDVKLIRQGKVFADTTDVYVMAWDAANGNYYATLDDSTFVEDYYRVEDGAANVVIRQLPVKRNVTVAANIADSFIRNDQDDTMIGELAVKPAAGTDTQCRIGDESGSEIRVSAENVAGSTLRKLVVGCNELGLRGTAGAAVKITNLAAGTAAADAITVSQLDTVKGSGWSSGMTLKNHDDRLANLEGSGTFSTPSVNIAATRHPLGVGLSWGMNSDPNEAAVLRYEVYMSIIQLAGAASGVLSAAQLAYIRNGMQRVNLAGIRDRTAFIPSDQNLYCIVIGFDHDSPSVACASAQTFAQAGRALDDTLPIIGGAANPHAALATLAGEVNTLRNLLGAGGVPINLFTETLKAAAGSGSAAAALTEWADATGAYVVKLRGNLQKSSLYRRILITVDGKSASGGMTVQFVCSTESAAESFSATGYVTKTWTVDLSNLTNGSYEWTLELKSNGANIATITKPVIFLTAA